ncbi:MAG: hypothetical protein ACK5OX_08795 [Desertimonas sp.]
MVAIGVNTWAMIGVWATIGVYVALAVFAWWQLQEARRLRAEQNRPFVVAELSMRSIIVNIAIRNVGNITARNVRVKLPTDLRCREGIPTWADSPIFTSGLPTMPPGHRLRYFLDTFPERRDAGLPMRIAAILTYEGLDGRQYGPEEYIIDLDAYGPALQDDKGLHELVEEAKRIRTEMQAWTQGKRGLAVHVSDADKAEARNWRPEHVSSVVKLRREKGWQAAVGYVIAQVRRELGLHEWGSRP